MLIHELPHLLADAGVGDAEPLEQGLVRACVRTVEALTSGIRVAPIVEAIQHPVLNDVISKPCPAREVVYPELELGAAPLDRAQAGLAGRAKKHVRQRDWRSRPMYVCMCVCVLTYGKVSCWADLGE